MLDVKKDFPIFEENPGLVYLDSAATSQRPNIVIDALESFSKKDNSNIARGTYRLAERAMESYNFARKRIADFIGAKEEEVIFTKNTTESINLLAATILPLIKEGKNEIVLSEMEHHSNLVPWQVFAKRHGFTLKFIPITKGFTLDYGAAKKLITNKTALVSITHVSNVLGTVNNIKEIVSLSQGVGALSIVDAAQSVAHISLDVIEIDCDFLVFSSHKVLGPLGIGVLYGKKKFLELLEPYQFGGGMVQEVSFDSFIPTKSPEKFEAGTQNIGEAIAFAKALDYISKISLERIKEHEEELFSYALEKLASLGFVEIYSPGKEKAVSLISFNIKGIHSHDVSSILGELGVAIRSGHHCAMPLMGVLGISSACRASFSVYTTKEDIDSLILGLKKVWEVFKK